MRSVQGDLNRHGQALLQLSITVSAPRGKLLRQAGVELPSPVSVQAVIDTGADRTVADRSVLEALGLEPTGTTWLHSVTSGSQPIQG